MSVESRLIRADKKSWVRTVWMALEEFQDEFYQGEHDEELNDEVCTAMAWIAEDLGLDPTDPDIHP